MSQLTKTKEHLVRIWTALCGCTVPQDGYRRYLYNIWQPLTILVLTASFAATFFTFKDPYASTSDLFYCNADGKVQMLEDGGYKPFWDPNLFFTINVSVGDNLSFTLAKLIDAIWDLGVGRGGQLLAAVIAYRVVRRSLTLVMETCTVTIPTVTSFCCERLTIQSSHHLLRDVVSPRSSRQYAGKRLSPRGRQRLLMQLSACVYVLVFPTLMSVMTGYRTGFTGVFNYTNDTTTEVRPLAQVGYPRLMIIDGSRIGLANSTAYLPRQIPFPKGVDLPFTDFLLSSESFEEPAGVLTDYFFTCLEVMEAAQSDQQNSKLSGPYEKPSTIACAVHNCSCSTAGTHFGKTAKHHSIPELSANTTGSITIDGTYIPLAAPPLDIRFSTYPHVTAPNRSNTIFYHSRSDHQTYDYQRRPYAGEIRFDGSTYTKDFVKDSGVCIASDQYSWEFSSLLLLTFCVYTMLFATILIALQTDVYTDSQFDRSHQSYSVYADILTIAEALKSIPEYNLPELLGSPREIDEKIGNRKHGMRFDTRGLPPGRSDEKWAAMEEKLREGELASGDQGATEEFELQRMDAVRLDLELEGDGLMAQILHQYDPDNSDEVRTMSGAI